jgi:hypothetical protein
MNTSKGCPMKIQKSFMCGLKLWSEIGLYWSYNIIKKDNWLFYVNSDFYLNILCQFLNYWFKVCPSFFFYHHFLFIYFLFIYFISFISTNRITMDHKRIKKWKKNLTRNGFMAPWQGFFFGFFPMLINRPLQLVLGLG